VNVSAQEIAAVARALNVDPQTVRADTPLESVGWAGSAGEWAVVCDHLGVCMLKDPAQEKVTTIGELVAIVRSVEERPGAGG